MSIDAKPPGSRCSAAPRATSREISSPSSPASRKIRSVSGETTKGGLETIRSKSSPSDRLEEAALAQLDVRDVVQLEVQAGHPERALRHVRRDDVLGVA